MRSSPEVDFVLVGSRTAGGRVYICKPGPDRNVWTAYDLEPGGQLINPRVVFGADQATGWRGIGEFA